MSDEDEFPDDVFETAFNIADGNHSETEIVRLIARAIMAERERCAGIIDAANTHYAEQHEVAKATKPKSEVRDLQTMRIATAGLAALIRGKAA
jgi:hypothetical protein